MSRSVCTAFIAILATGCTCEGPATRRSADAHFPEFDALLARSAAGDLEGAKTIARELTPDDDMAELAAALGFIQVAIDAEELASGTEAAATACRSCHQRER